MGTKDDLPVHNVHLVSVTIELKTQLRMGTTLCFEVLVIPW